MKKPFLYLLFSLWMSIALGQAVGIVALRNQQIVGTDVFFDVYLQADSATGERIYLGHTDIKLTYNPGAFTSPSFQKVDNGTLFFGLQKGFNELIPIQTDGGGMVDVSLQAAYHAGIATDILSGNELVINLNAPEVAIAADLRTQISEIDSLLDVHRLGRFQISGYSGGSVDLLVLSDGRFPEIGTYDTTGLGSPAYTQNLIRVLDDPLLPLEWLELSVDRGVDGNVVLRGQMWVQEAVGELTALRRGTSGEIQVVGNQSIRSLDPQILEIEFWDEAPLDGINWYQLSFQDIRGRQSYSDWVEVKAKLKPSQWVRIYPNPARAMLHLESLIEAKGPISFFLYDTHGQLIRQGWMEETMSLNISSLSRGIYFLELKTGIGRSIYRKIMVSR